MLVHLGLAQPPPGWQEGRYDNVARMHGAQRPRTQPQPAIQDRRTPNTRDYQPMVPQSPGGNQPNGDNEGGGASAGSRWPRLPTVRTEEPPYNKEDEIVYGCDYTDERSGQDPPYINQLQYDLATSYYWSGNFGKDFVFFVANWHPLFGIICSHPHHPWMKHERLLSFMVSCSLTLLPSAYFVDKMELEQHKTWRETHLFIFISVTLPVMIIEVFLYLFAMAPVYCRGNCLCAPIVALIVVLKKLCFCVAFLITIIVVSLTLTLMHGLPPEELIRPFMLSRMQSWVYWFPLWFLMPCCGFCPYWHSEARAAEKAAAQP